MPWNEIKPKRKKPVGAKLRWKPGFVTQAKVLCKLGATNEDIAEACRVDVSTVSRWKSTRKEYKEAIKDAKAIADDKVVASLFKRATGYEAPDSHISSYEGNITVTPITKHVPPDPTSCIFWLKNRRRQEWGEHNDAEGKLVNLSISFASLNSPQTALIPERAIDVPPEVKDAQNGS